MYPTAEIEAVLNRCREYNLVNDAQLAEDFALSQSSRGRGSRRIAMELRRHGLTGEAAANALEKISGEDENSAVQALAGKLASWKNETDWRKRREKAFRFLANRGFPLDIISGVVNALFVFYALYKKRLFKMTVLLSKANYAAFANNSLLFSFIFRFYAYARSSYTLLRASSILSISCLYCSILIIITPI